MARDTIATRDTEASKPARERLGEALGEALGSTPGSVTRAATALGGNIKSKRSWLSKVLHGKPKVRLPSDEELADLASFARADQQLAVWKQLRDEVARERASTGESRPRRFEVEILKGEEQVIDGITHLIDTQGSRAVLRNTGVKGPGAYHDPSPTWLAYREALQKFLAANPQAQMRRLEHVTDAEQLEQARRADLYLETRTSHPDRRQQADVKFRRLNPVDLHLLIGEREALLAFPVPDTKEHRSRIALVVRDQEFVAALTDWYDRALWDRPGVKERSNEDFVDIKFDDFDSCFAEVAQMFGIANWPLEDSTDEARMPPQAHTTRHPVGVRRHQSGSQR